MLILVSELWGFFNCIMCRYFYHGNSNLKKISFFNYICATPKVSAHFLDTKNKINFHVRFWNSDILNHKMRLSLYIVHQSNIVLGFFLIHSCIKEFFFCLDSYFKSHNNNYIVCSFYHHAFHITNFLYTINFLWILFF